MPQPVPLATREEEDRRAWVTAHHEVVRLVKDCFGDRFSNNEIFDRLKISRRTGYRALGNDERIGKAPGRKPKITEQTIQDMIDYIEAGGCNDVGNVWKHLATKFAPDCNPKTVQDAIKKSGFRNHRDTVKLEPLLAEHIPDGQPAPSDEDQVQQLQQLEHQTQVQQHTPHQQLQQETQSAIDPMFQQQNGADQLRASIETGPEGHIRYVLLDVCQRIPDAAQIASSYLCPFLASSVPPQLHHMGAASLHSQLEPTPMSPVAPSSKRRTATCRRCGQGFDRAENTMENRSCLYHKGSPQKIAPEEAGSIERSPEAYIWSCCGGNGKVPGCCRAMHTTKKKRTYGKKRDADTAGFDDDDDDDNINDVDSGVDDSGIDASQMQNSNIDARLQDLHQPSTLPLASHHLPIMQLLPAGMSGAVGLGHADMGAQMSHEVQPQLGSS